MTPEKSDTPLTDALMAQEPHEGYTIHALDPWALHIDKLMQHARDLERKLRAAESAQAPSAYKCGECGRTQACSDVFCAWAGPTPQAPVAGTGGDHLDKALLYDLDQAGIEQRHKESVELVELRAQVEALKRERDQMESDLREIIGSCNVHYRAMCAAEQRADRLQAQVFEDQGEITNLQSHLLALGADSYFAMYGWNVVEDGKDEAGEPFTIERAVAAIQEEQARGRKASAEAGNELCDRLDALADEKIALQAELDTAKVDAERYRWLKAQNEFRPDGLASVEIVVSEDGSTTETGHQGDELDAAIDAARAKEVGND